MTSDNLAIVFAPNILRPAVETPITMMDSDSKIRCVSLLIERTPDIFKKQSVPQPPKTPSYQGIPQPPRQPQKPPAKPFSGLSPPSKLSSQVMRAAPPKLSSSVEPSQVTKPKHNLQKEDEEEFMVVSHQPSYASQYDNPYAAARQVQQTSSLPEVQRSIHRVQSSQPPKPHRGLPTRATANSMAMPSRQVKPSVPQNVHRSSGSGLFRLGTIPASNPTPPPPKTKPQNMDPEEDSTLTLRKINERIQDLEQQRKQILKDNEAVNERADQLQLHHTAFQSEFQPKMEEFWESVAFYTENEKQFVQLLHRHQVPTKDILTPMEKLHEKVKKTQIEHIHALNTLGRFYENCVSNLPKSSLQEVEPLVEEINSLKHQKRAAEKQSVSKPPPKPPKPPFIAPTSNQCVALGKYEGGHHPDVHELVFDKGDLIILTVDEEQAGWLQGRLANDPDAPPGWFPSAWVKRG